MARETTSAVLSGRVVSFPDRSTQMDTVVPAFVSPRTSTIPSRSTPEGVVQEARTADLSPGWAASPAGGASARSVAPTWWRAAACALARLRVCEPVAPATASATGAAVTRRISRRTRAANCTRSERRLRRPEPSVNRRTSRPAVCPSVDTTGLLSWLSPVRASHRRALQLATVGSHRVDHQDVDGDDDDAPEGVGLDEEQVGDRAQP